MEYEIISQYTRQQAIQDGVLIPFSDERLKYPAVITDYLSSDVSDTAAMVTDFITAVKANHGKEDYLSFKHNDSTLWAHFGPDDDGFPCLTFGYPSDF